VRGVTSYSLVKIPPKITKAERYAGNLLFYLLWWSGIKPEDPIKDTLFPKD
jgi:hypothetical protein